MSDLYLPMQRLTLPAVPNAWQVAGKIFRGAQPDLADRPDVWQLLARECQIQRVINLRTSNEQEDQEQEDAAIKAAGMEVCHVPMNSLLPPTEAQFTAALSFMDYALGPIFVHCREGKDRTGAVIAAYQLLHGASRRQAWDEFWRAQSGIGEAWMLLDAIDYAREHKI